MKITCLLFSAVLVCQASLASSAASELWNQYQQQQPQHQNNKQSKPSGPVNAISPPGPQPVVLIEPPVQIEANFPQFIHPQQQQQQQQQLHTAPNSSSQNLPKARYMSVGRSMTTPVLQQQQIQQKPPQQSPTKPTNQSQQKPPPQAQQKPQQKPLQQPKPQQFQLPKPSQQQQPKLQQNAKLNYIEPVNSPKNPETNPPKCLTDNKFFNKPEECLLQSKQQIIGLPAYKNSDFLERSEFIDRKGCIFLLTNGAFKDYAINKNSFRSDGKCAESSKAKFSIEFHNVTLSYLWELRCLNKANQVQDHSSKDTSIGEKEVCVGSSQTLGFTELQLSNIEAEVEFAIDVYKTWRVANISVLLSPNHEGEQKKISTTNNYSTDVNKDGNSDLATSLKEFKFEFLDGDEMSWKYKSLFENWTRNKLHTSFLDQFRRYLWISLQRCAIQATEDRANSSTNATNKLINYSVMRHY